MHNNLPNHHNDSNEQTGLKYKVLARKYRPQKLSEVIGQDILVQTISNAINSNKLAHAIIFTGTRGVGKTTTARIIARSLNCVGQGDIKVPTVNPCNVCYNCQAIAESRHPDVLEMDAASHTSINDIRVIIENAIYKPTSARYKIYIVDEVHMLSNSAFNALLKTLEEPPPHLKFIFATTEIRKIPITILSRCQRFNLKRISINELAKHYINIASLENCVIEEEAINIIAKAADGSVRDGLSMLDQAISLGNGNIHAETVNSMLGIIDKDKTLKLFDFLVEGKIQDCLKLAQNLYDLGTEPMLILQDLLDVVYNISQTKLNQKTTIYSSSESSKEYINNLAEKLSVVFLSRVWQMFIKGIEELKNATQHFACLEMILIRIAYTSNLPTPEELLKQLETKSDTNINTVKTHQKASNSEITVANSLEKTVANRASKYLTSPDQKNISATSAPIQSIEQLLDLVYEKHEMVLYHILRNEIGIIELRDNYLKIVAKENSMPNVNLQLQKQLSQLTNTNWIIELVNNVNILSLVELGEEEIAQKKKRIEEHELVQNILKTFTGIEITDIKIAKKTDK